MSTHRWSVVTASATFLLLLAGGLVHSTGSGLACPDWPLCFGKFFPPMVGNIRFEHGHRLIAATVGLLTLATAICAWRDSRRELRPWAGWAAGLVLVQSVIGGLTVIYRLPDLVSTAHLAAGTAFFGILMTLAIRSSPRADGLSVEVDGGTRVSILAAAAIVYAQMILGALVRHSESGLACPDFPTCKGEWLVSIATPGGLQMAHRAGSIVVLAAVTVVLFRSLSDRRLSAWAASAFGLTLVQMILGLASVTTGLGLWAVMSHLAAAELLFFCLIVMAVRTKTSVASLEFSEMGTQSAGAPR